MSLIKVDKVVKRFGDTHALNELTLEFEKGGQYFIRGASGSGKSTLLYLLGGLDRPSAGSVIIDGKKLSSLNDEQLAEFRNQYIGFVFQFHFLLPSMSSLNNILLPAKIGGRESISEVKSFALELAEALGVSHCLKKYPFQLSGGEQQRINLIRALSLKPKLLLCDEPTGSLDSENSKNVTQLVKNLAAELGATLIVVTHDLVVAQSFEQGYTLVDGKLA